MLILRVLHFIVLFHEYVVCELFHCPSLWICRLVVTRSDKRVTKCQFGHPVLWIHAERAIKDV